MLQQDAEKLKRTKVVTIAPADPVWTIGDNTVHGLNPSSGDEVVSIRFGGYTNHFPTPSVGGGLLLLPGTDQVCLHGPDLAPAVASRSLVAMGTASGPRSTVGVYGSCLSGSTERRTRCSPLRLHRSRFHRMAVIGVSV
jgi:hypothetical protein